MYILGYHRDDDKNVQLISKEEAELIKQKVDAINEKYGIPKKWRAKKGEEYWYINNSGDIICGTETYWIGDDEKYNFGNYFQTKEEAEKKLEKIKQILSE